MVQTDVEQTWLSQNSEVCVCVCVVLLVWGPNIQTDIHFL